MTTAVFTIVLRKGYGLGAQAMAGGSFHAPFFIVSWPTGNSAAWDLRARCVSASARNWKPSDAGSARGAVQEKSRGILCARQGHQYGGLS